MIMMQDPPGAKTQSCSENRPICPNGREKAEGWTVATLLLTSHVVSTNHVS